MEARTVYEFTAANPQNEELSFPQGCILKILDDSDPNWYKAEYRGKDGYVPANYIQYEKPIWFMSVSKDLSSKILKVTKNGRPRHPEGTFLVRPSQNSPGDMSLTVKLGQDVQHFRILRSDSRDKYYLWSDAPHFSSVNQLVAHYRKASVSKSSATAYLKDINLNRVVVLYHYMPQQDDQIEIREGDSITVIDDSDQDWWEGVLMRDGAPLNGFFPANYVGSS